MAHSLSVSDPSRRDEGLETLEYYAKSWYKREQTEIGQEIQ